MISVEGEERRRKQGREVEREKEEGTEKRKIGWKEETRKWRK